MSKAGKAAIRSTAAAPATGNAGQTPGKGDRMIKRLNSARGASIADLCTLTGWQPHTVRAALSRLRKAGHPIARKAGKDGKAVYRIDADAGSGA
ncbi:DUF3489 domain-containing protein [Nitratireductor sp. CAU 1489]|uniref:DUF3489 domain-containing protein n=1 Tax=Nitratireductor arenosus TaxID=2682096 RepID=A0A844QE59_9HYPH|nr:DUF3489 domain-containing protein [Nitratireductor arenosus]MVA96281.1 DUF3489 domain-containing protein [Nitratireductor arenosus]